jgi:hypothetical protein
MLPGRSIATGANHPLGSGSDRWKRRVGAGGSDNGSSPFSTPGAAMASESPAPILPGTTVVVSDAGSIYNGYRGFVQRISGRRAAVLFEGGNWDKLITVPLTTLTAV